MRDSLSAARQQIKNTEASYAGATKVHIAGVGTTISTAYEQLRNAAEYTEEHLLLQRAIRRFLKRNVSFFEKRTIGKLGEELIIELTQSDYLLNDTVPKSSISDIESLLYGYYDVYWQFRKAHVSQSLASKWTLDTMSVTVEAVFNKADNIQTEVFADFACNHYETPLQRLFTGKPQEYKDSLYIAVHRALLKSDISIVRSALINRDRESFADLKEYIHFNKKIDTLFESPNTDKLVRLISRNGAPLRILRRLVLEYSETEKLLGDRSSFLSAFGAQIEKEYKNVERKVNKGVLKSIAFLFITKVIVGLAIEIPYDFYVTGAIIWLPLIINLLFPPSFMASLRLTMKLPRQANTQALSDYIDDVFYQSEEGVYKVYAKTPSGGSTLLLNVIYGAMFIFVFSLVTVRLVLWDFGPVHIFVFFLFLSTASFLGFRLSRLIRELEMVNTNQGFVAVVRDFAYTPFIMIGRWISDKYSRINVIALILDLAIELPLKTLLRLIRQWTKFLNDKADEL